MTDFSFIKLFKNDFTSAKLADDAPISYSANNGLPNYGFIIQKPSEYFLQITSGTTSISFVGGITIDLIDCSNTLIQNIDNNFFYEGFIDSSGVSQIAFAFGFIGTDYWSKQLFLRITDGVNGDVWYSNGFLITENNTELSTRFDYFNTTKIYNISYDLAPYIQSVRIAECYDQTPVNKREVKQYVNSSGRQVNYRTITTFLRKYFLNKIDNFINDRLEVLFAHQQVYCNGQSVVVSDYKVDERKGDTNFMNGEFVINPQLQTLANSYQLYDFLDLVSRTPEHLGAYTIANLPDLSLTFNKNITLASGFIIKLYKGGVLQSITPTTYNITGNLLDITPSYSFTNGSYSITIDPDTITSGAESFSGIGATEWTFDVTSGEYDNTQYNNEFLLN